ncbi:hypothetical protein BX666DRAFT_1888990 [Dichotomocladium elegans]|nr:hypothetical protein BX666DRAFT_1888990 [Dichotomocladium elegans]
MLRKRMTVSECASLPNYYYVCSPMPNETWYQDNDYQFIWKNMGPYYIASGPGSDLSTSYIDIHLYYRKNYAYHYIRNWTDIPLISGELDVTVTSDWFPTASGTNTTWSMYGYILPNGTNATAELLNTVSMYPRPFNFTAFQLGDGVTTNNGGTGGTGQDATSPSGGGGDHLPGWAIAVIVIAVLALVAVTGLIIWGIWFFRRRKPSAQQKQQEQERQRLQQQPPTGAMRQLKGDISRSNSPGSGSQGTFRAPVYDGASIHSSTPIATGGAAPGSARDSATTEASYGSRPRTSPPADSFRNLLQHYPDWKSTTVITADPASDDTEIQRRRLGEAILQRELQEEGAAVKHTDHRPLPIQTVAPPSQPVHESTAVVLERSPSS